MSAAAKRLLVSHQIKADVVFCGDDCQWHIIDGHCALFATALESGDDWRDRRAAECLASEVGGDDER